MKKSAHQLKASNQKKQQKNNIFQLYVNTQQVYQPEKKDVVINSIKEIQHSKQNNVQTLINKSLPQKLENKKMDSKQIQTTNQAEVNRYNSDYVAYNGQLAKILQHERLSDKPIINEMIKIQERQKQKFSLCNSPSFLDMKKQQQQQQLKDAQNYRLQQLSINNLDQFLQVKCYDSGRILKISQYKEDYNIYNNKDMQIRTQAGRMAEEDEQSQIKQQYKFDPHIDCVQESETDGKVIKLGVDFDDEPSMIVTEQNIMQINQQNDKNENQQTQQTIVENENEEIKKEDDTKNAVDEIKDKSLSFVEKIQWLKELLAKRKEQSKQQLQEKQPEKKVLSFNTRVLELKQKYEEHKKTKSMIEHTKENVTTESIVQPETVNKNDLAFNKRVVELKQKYLERKMQRSNMTTDTSVIEDKQILTQSNDNIIQELQTVNTDVTKEENLNINENAVDEIKDKSLSFVEKIQWLKELLAKRKEQSKQQLQEKEPAQQLSEKKDLKFNTRVLELKQKYVQRKVQRSIVTTEISVIENKTSLTLNNEIKAEVSCITNTEATKGKDLLFNKNVDEIKERYRLRKLEKQRLKNDESKQESEKAEEKQQFYKDQLTVENKKQDLMYNAKVIELKAKYAEHKRLKALKAEELKQSQQEAVQQQVQTAPQELNTLQSDQNDEQE